MANIAKYTISKGETRYRVRYAGKPMSPRSASAALNVKAMR